MRTLAIVGGGSWGTALAVVLAPNFEHVRLWIHDPVLAAQVATTHVNEVYLPGIVLPANVTIHSRLGEALSAADIVLGAMPSHHARALYQQIQPWTSASTLFVSATKGLENTTLLRISQVMADVLGPSAAARITVLSGPSFAHEVGRGEPALVTIAGGDRAVLTQVQQSFWRPAFRPYLNPDIVGVEIGGALKNIIAIAAGVCQELGLGNNTIAALITRGLAEITRLAVALGGDAKTLAGLAGLGDLVLTCTGDLSRNRRVGRLLAAGQTIDEIVAGTRMVAEGIETTNAAVELSSRLAVDLPITAQMHRIIRHGKPPRDAIRELMERTLKEE